jgi:hypothetical protein
VFINTVGKRARQRGKAGEKEKVVRSEYNVSIAY